MFLAESLNTGRGLFVFSLDLYFFLSSSAGELIWGWDGSPSNLKSTWWRVPYPLTEADKNKIHSCDTDEETKAQDGEMIRSRRHTLKINLPRALCFLPCSLPLWKEIQTLLVQGSVFTCSLAFLRTWPPLPLAYSTWSTLNTGQILVMTEETEEVRCEEEKVDFEVRKYFMCWVGYLKPNIFFKINLFIVGCAAWPASSCPSPADKGTSFPLEEAAQKTQIVLASLHSLVMESDQKCSIWVHLKIKGSRRGEQHTALELLIWLSRFLLLFIP